MFINKCLLISHKKKLLILKIVLFFFPALVTKLHLWQNLTNNKTFIYSTNVYTLYKYYKYIYILYSVIIHYVLWFLKSLFIC